MTKPIVKEQTPTSPTQQTPIPLTVDIVSDVVCPWCIIGFKQLEKALSSLPEYFVPEFHWHPFELNPSMPEDGQNMREHLTEKYGASAASDSGTRSRLKELGESLGFSFNHSSQSRMVNTFKAHQLLEWAAQFNLQTPLKLALFKAFFSDQENVNDMSVLITVAASVGLSETDAKEVLQSGRFADSVRQHQQYWREQDIYSVPMFYFNQAYAIPGAQDSDTFIRYLKKIHEKEMSKQ